MDDFAANLLGVVGLAVTDRIKETARDILNHVGETPAALVVIGYDLGPSNDQLRHILGLSHPGSTRLVERLVDDGLVERRAGQDKRAVALYLTNQGKRVRKKLLKERLTALHPFLVSLSDSEMKALTALLRKMLSSLEPTDLERCQLCRLCDGSVCTDCPIPADFRGKQLQKS